MESGSFCNDQTGIIKGHPFGGNQTMQMYGNFEGFPFNGALFGLVSYNDPLSKAVSFNQTQRGTIIPGTHLGVSKNNGTPKSSILIGFSIRNHPFWRFSPYFWKHPFILCFGGCFILKNSRSFRIKNSRVDPRSL